MSHKTYKYQSFGAAYQQGVSLIEAMITVTILLIVISIGAPSYARAMRDQEVSRSTSSLFLNLRNAYSIARNEGVDVTVCAKKVGDVQCANALSADSWNNGWIVFKNNDNDPTTFDKSIDVLIKDQPASEDDSVRFVANSAQTISKRITFKKSKAWATDTAGTIAVCYDKDIPPRKINVAYPGSIETKRIGVEKFNDVCV